MLEGGLIVLSSIVALALIFVAPRPHPMWASCTLYVHVFYCHTMLTLETVPHVSERIPTPPSPPLSPLPSQCRLLLTQSPS